METIKKYFIAGLGVGTIIVGLIFANCWNDLNERFVTETQANEENMKIISELSNRIDDKNNEITELKAKIKELESQPK